MMILLVDNDEAFRERLLHSLGWLGDEVYACSSPQELPPLSSLRNPKALLTRYELPEEDGLSLVDRFHEVHPTVPIFLLTNAWSPYLAEQARLRRCVWVCQVPVGYEDLCSLIVSVCGRGRYQHVHLAARPG